MPETETVIPPEAWPLMSALFNVTLAFAAVWLAVTVFVAWRRNASNLTAVHDAERNRRAQPDFLSVDAKERKEAMRRADQFESDLDKRDRDEARSERRKAREQATMLQRATQLISFGMALFSLATMISGTMFQVSIMGRYWEQYSAGERLAAVIREHPIGVAITVAVILYNIARFVVNRSWQKEA
ncbi:MAG: hypothetical protein AAFX03_10970 [Pseudomonadota bacterium]